MLLRSGDAPWAAENESAIVDGGALPQAGAEVHPFAASFVAPAIRRQFVASSVLDGSETDAPGAIDAAYEHCRVIAREIARTFYYGSLFLAPAKRRAAWALYAFCRIADDIADEPGSTEDALAQLRLWRQAICDTYAGQPRGPVMRAWADLLTRFDVPLQPALDLLDGVEMDLVGASYATFDDLRLYCYRVAGTVGLLMAPVLGYEHQDALPYAVDLGIAMQLTNILRDIGEDASHGRIYLPGDEMLAAGYSADELLQGVITPAFVELMRFQIARADAYYARGLYGVRLLHPDARFAIALSGALYQGILHRIRRNRFDVFSRRAHISLPGKLAAVPGVWVNLKRDSYARLAH